LHLCVSSTQDNPSLDRVWLLCVGVFDAFPSPDDVRAAARFLALSSPEAAGNWLLERARAVQAGIAEERWRVVEEEVRSRRAALRETAVSSGADTAWARVRAAGAFVVVRVPPARRLVRFGRRRLRAAGFRAAAFRQQLRARLHHSGVTVQTASGHDLESGGELLVVTDRVVVDVDHSARHDLHTGIQQVVRRTLPLWERDHLILPVAWTDDRAAWRTLSLQERHRVLRRGQEGPAGPNHRQVLVVPWRTVVVLAETPPDLACGRLAALAQYSGNEVVAVGYDCIPVVSADLVPASEPQRFARYLTVLKYASRIAAVSDSAATEFAGFAAAVPAQGLSGPAVLECPLAVEAPVAILEQSATGAEPPLVVCVASLEPRKNHLALLYAAERLWREGLHFQLLLIAGSGWGEEVPARIRQLQQAGRLVTARRSATDGEVAAAYRSARFSVLPSLHEGFGLPVAESLAWGTPAITSNYGSTQEVAADGGALLIDPRDDAALVDAMRRLLTDDILLATLRQQARARPSRTWEQYAADLWDHLVRPVPHHPTGPRL
jgi:glycosyltransferase involved in cell wall biosynthesis